jgi:tRNA(Ile)-lysidine synthetase-like protein
MSLTDIYNFWFDNEDMWFSSTPETDKIILDKFSPILLNPPEISTTWTHQESIGYILLFDQITRHVNRNNSNKEVIIQEHLEKILPFAKNFYDNNKYTIHSEEFAFVMLPFRHTKKYEKFIFTVNEAWDKLKNTNSDSDSDSIKNDYIRFLKASYERYLKFSLNKQYEGENIILYEPQSRKIISDDLKEILDERCKIAELMENTDDKIHKIINYLDPKKQYILSLSGGVDSMVLSYILHKKNIKFVAVHISYCNRKECEQEVQFLKEWCDIIQVKLYFREIHEIKRKDCMDYGLRELYEEYTRDIRFNTYKLVSEIINQDNSETNVFLGHNKNDRFENILTNIAGQSHYDNLTGMELIQNMSDINFYRPLLNTTKEEIYEFAHKLNIQHLPNSTPSWSQRGKIRDQVKPTLMNWNPVIVDSFFKLSKELGSYVKFIESLADDTAQELKVKKVIRFNINSIPTLEYYWLHVFRVNDIWLTTKSNINWVEKISYIKDKFKTFELNNVSKVNLTKDKQILWKKINSNEIQIILT